MLAISVGWARRLGPGVAISALVAALALLVQAGEVMLWQHAVIEGLVVAILLGMLARSFVRLPATIQPGVSFSAKQVLECAIVLLGASVNASVVLASGPALLLAIALVVISGIAASFMIGRSLGLNTKLAVLVACGNSICGNSAIAAVAPVIDADNEDVAASIALTAVLGVAVVLLLPLLIPLLHLSFYQYGMLAGLTVYAVPQVLAATLPISALSGQVGTLVKLMRVLMLGPVVFFFAVRFPHEGQQRFSISRYVPWFIVGFLGLALLRSLGVLPEQAAAALAECSRWLTVLAMAALGLGVDARSLRGVGRPVLLAVLGSLAVLIGASLFAIHVLGVA